MSTPFSACRFGAPIVSFSDWQSASEYLRKCPGPGREVRRRVLRWHAPSGRHRWTDAVMERVQGGTP
jgi:hypothetical protein